MEGILKKKPVNLHDQFYCKSHLFGNKIAISFYSDERSELSITYKELNQICLKTYVILSNHLKSGSDTGVNTVFGLYCDSGIHVVILILAILRNGAFFYLSPDLTRNELNILLERASIRYIIIQNNFVDKIPERFSPKIITSFEVFNIHFNLISLRISESNHTDLPKNSLAYVISTSGTTGFPKIVYVSHVCISQNIEDFKSIFKITMHDTILNLSPLHFDPSIVDIFLALSYGAQLIVLSPHILKKPRALERIISCNSVTFIQITPTLFGTLNPDFIQSIFSKGILKTIAFGGENFPSHSHWKPWFDINSTVNIYNLYGLTELSCWASYYKVNMCQFLTEKIVENVSLYCPVPLGKPLTGVKVFLIDKFGNQITKGKGQIVLNGERNLCYIDDPEKPNLKVGNNIITGDIGFSDGVDLFFVGRFDNIIKRNACKVSLTEIELVSQYLKEVKESCAIYWDNKISLFISSSSNSLSESLVKNHLKSFLLPWKLPDQVIIKDELPLNRNFKVDKKSLKISVKNLKLLKNVRSKGKELYLLQSLWKEFIGHNPDDEENFINSGGNSLQAVQLSEKIISYFPNNPLILQTIINNKYKDLCNLVYKNSKVSRQDFPNNIFIRSAENHNLKVVKDNFEVVHHGGHSICKMLKFSFNNFFVKWAVNLDKCVDSSPLIIEKENQIRIFIGSHSHKFLCVDNHAKIYWKLNLPDRIEASACISSGGDSVFIGCYDGSLYSIDIISGKRLWKIMTGGIIKTSCTVDIPSNSIIFGSYDKHLYCCNELGILKWKAKLTDGYIKSSSVVANNFVFTGTLDGYIVCSCLRTGNLVWKIFIGKPIFSSLALSSNGIVFGCADSFVYCVNFDSTILWKFETNGPIFSSPCVLQKDSLKVIGIGSHDNYFYLLDIFGKKHFAFQAFSPIYSTPFIIAETLEKFYILFAETKGCVYCLEVHVINGIYKPHNVMTIQLSDSVFSSPVFYKGNIYIGCRDNMLYCLNI